MTRSSAQLTFWALSDMVRLEILDHVAEGSKRTVTELAAVMPITRQAVARHVKTLEDSGLLVGERAGREQLYHVDLASMQAATSWLDKRALKWEKALDRLAEHLDES